MGKLHQLENWFSAVPSTKVADLQNSTHKTVQQTQNRMTTNIATIIDIPYWLLFYGINISRMTTLVNIRDFIFTNLDTGNSVATQRSHNYCEIRENIVREKRVAVAPTDDAQPTEYSNSSSKWFTALQMNSPNFIFT